MVFELPRSTLKTHVDFSEMQCKWLQNQALEDVAKTQKIKLYGLVGFSENIIETH